MKKQKKILCGMLSCLCVATLGVGIAMLPMVTAIAETKNKDFFSATGGTLAVTEDSNGLKLALSNVSTEITNEDIVSVSYNNYINVSDLATGITFWNSSAINAREFEFMSIVLRDSEDPTQVMTTHLQRGDWYGNDWQLASVGLWDEYTYTYTGKQNYVYNGVATSGAAAGRERVTVNNGSYVIHDGADGMCGGGDMGSVIWGSEGTVSPFTFTFSNSTVMINNLTVANLTDAAYFEKAIANVSESEQPELYDNINATYAANLFSSGKVTMELQFGNVTDGEFDVYVQKMGSKNLKSTNNYQSTSISGSVYTGTAIPMTGDVIQFPGTYSAADISKGIMFQVLPNVISTPAASHVRVVIRDSADPTKAVTAGVMSAWWYGEWKSISVFKQGVFNRTDNLRWGDGTTTIDINESYDLNATLADELGIGDDVNRVGTIHGFFSANGTTQTATSAVKVVYDGTTLTINNRGANNRVSGESILSSGFATVEIQFGVTATDNTLNGMVNLISVGDTSLANLSMGAVDSLVDNMSPVFTAESSVKLEANKAYTLDEIKSFVSVNDNISVNEFSAVVYNKDGVAYEGSSFTFAANAGDYIVYTAKDEAGNQATVTVSVCVEASFTVTEIVDGVETTEDVVEGEVYVFESATIEGKVFVGWKINDELYPANYTITISEAVTATAIAIEFEMVAGASIRMDVDQPGIRWAATLSENDKDSLDGYATEWGVKVTSGSKQGYLAIPVDKWVNDGKTEFRCAMTEMDESVEDGLYDIVFEGRAYVKVTYANGAKTTIWAIANDNARSVSQVAVNVYDQVSPEMQAILDEFITLNGVS